MMRRTLAAPVSVRGITLHGGQQVRLTLHPAPAGRGIWFRRSDPAGQGPDGQGLEIAALWSNAVDSLLCTTLQSPDGRQVRTVEHLLFALAVCGIDDVVAELDGDEVPILDGSARPLVELVTAAGVAVSDRPRRWLEVLRPVTIVEGEARITLEPSPVYALDLSLPDPAFGLLRWQGTITPALLRHEIAPARTFGALKQVVPAILISRLRGLRLLRGASLSCALVLVGRHVLNRGGFRLPDELVRHRVLDCVGDMMLAGAPLKAKVTAYRTRHCLNRQVLAALHADPGAWRWSADPES